jgi:hypothetical protein
MKYDCGHEGCDICGVRECAGFPIKHIDKYYVCSRCLPKAILYAIRASEEWSTYIDLCKPCGHPKEDK